MSHRRKGSGHQHRADADPPTDLLVADTAGRGESCSLPKEGRDLETVFWPSRSSSGAPWPRWSTCRLS